MGQHCSPRALSCLSWLGPAAVGLQPAAPNPAPRPAPVSVLPHSSWSPPGLRGMQWDWPQPSSQLERDVGAELARPMARSCFSLGLQFSLLVAFFLIVIFQTHSEKVETRGRGAAVCPRLSLCFNHPFTWPDLRSLLLIFSCLVALYSWFWLFGAGFDPVFPPVVRVIIFHQPFRVWKCLTALQVLA